VLQQACWFDMEQAAVLQVLVQELLAEWAEEVALPQLVVV
jgi:hypothetical protein